MMVPNNGILIASGKPVSSSNYQYRSLTGTWGTDATSGQVPVGDAYSYALSYRVATQTSVGVGLRVEGKFRNRWADLYTASVYSAMTIDEVINSEVRVSYVRIGFRAQGIAATTDNVVYADLQVAE